MCAFDGGAFDSVAFDVCIPTPSPSGFQLGGGGDYDPFYWDRIRRKREAVHWFTFKATTTGNLIFTPDASFAGYVDSVTVKRIVGDNQALIIAM